MNFLTSNKKTQNKYPYKSLQSLHLLRFGKFGIKINVFKLISQPKLEVWEFLITKFFKKLESKKKIKLWNLLILNQNLTKQPSESRMGKGKGSIYVSSIFLKPGTILFEIDNTTLHKIQKTIKFFSKKSSLNITLVQK